ncbi:MAG: hypothetical protein R3F15_08030 [Lysobacterales bacterium]
MLKSILSPSTRRSARALIVLGVLPVVLLSACGKAAPQDQVATQVQRLVTACSNKIGDYSGAAGLVAYNGSDKARKFKALASAEGEERGILNSTCYQISKLLDGKGDYELLGFSEEAESEGTWYVQQVRFGSGREAALAFIEIDGTLALGDIDS